MTRSLRIAILGHSVNPRGGIVHALELAEALAGCGHRPVVHAPDPKGAGFFRKTSFPTVAVEASGAPNGVLAMVKQRAAEYVVHFENPAHRCFDIYHAQDGISANALATLKARGLIDAFARTVHHLDEFGEPELDALQRRAVTAADRHFVVSRLWQQRLRARYGVTSDIVGNGVDMERFSAEPDGREDAIRARLGLGDGPIFLAVGGVEARKNTVGILDAFAQVRALHRDAQLLIVGGASVLDHAHYQQRFASAYGASRLPASAMTMTGPVADDDLPAFYRIADALVFPSVEEGFGLVVLEAMASGLPVIVSRIAPFTEYLGADDCLWCGPDDPRSIADAMVASLDAALRERLREKGLSVARRHSWDATAKAHLPAYRSLDASRLEAAYA